MNIIKKDGKFYRQVIQEDEVHLDDLEETIVEVKKRKSESIAEQTKDFDNQIAEVQDEINQIKSLKNK